MFIKSSAHDARKRSGSVPWWRPRAVSGRPMLVERTYIPYFRPLLAFVAVIASGLCQAADIGWPEAVARLAETRSRAETCAALLKRHGDEARISRGRVAYGIAKADIDSVIAGLTVALAEGGTPASLPSLQTGLGRGVSHLAEFCDSTTNLVPDTSVARSSLYDLLKGPIEALVKPLSDGVATLYNNHRNDDALTRRAIQTQLEAARWPDFAEVRAAQ